MTHFVYPVHLSRDEDGRVLVEFPDFPFAVTDGGDVAEALAEASDCLEEALAICIGDGLAIPEPTRFRRAEVKGQWLATVAPGPVIAAKAALYQSVRAEGITKVALAARLGMAEKEVRRMLDPRYATKIPALNRALATLGKRLEVTVVDAPVVADAPGAEAVFDTVTEARGVLPNPLDAVTKAGPAMSVHKAAEHAIGKGPANFEKRVGSSVTIEHVPAKPARSGAKARRRGGDAA